MSLYESVIIIKPDVPSTLVDRITEELEKILESCGAKIVKHEYLGSRSLAYKIQNHNRAHYVLLCIDGPSAAINEYNRKIKLSENIIRFFNKRVEQFTDIQLPKYKNEPEINVTENK
jgi:small subunit ribosomal protein S6